MNTVTHANARIPAGLPPVSDPDAVQRVVTRRLAMRLGVSLPVAAAVASLAGLGPQSGRVGR